MNRRYDPEHDPDRPRTAWEREGRPRRPGEHASQAIKDETGDASPDWLDGMDDAQKLLAIWRAIQDGPAQGASPMQASQVKRWFDHTIGWPFVATVILALVGVMWAGVQALRQYQTDQATTAASIATVAANNSASIAKVQSDTNDNINKMLAGIQDLKTQVQNDRDAIKANQQAAELRATTYIPRVQAVEEDNKVQSERIQNLAVSTANIRDSISDLTKISRETHEDMAIIKTQIQMRSPAGPHSQIETPPKEQVGAR